MKTFFVTGGAGFIGSNFILYMLRKYEDIRIINLDALTYAGNLENLREIEGDERHIFVEGSICDEQLVASLFKDYDIDYLINFAAESHVDRSISDPMIFVRTNVLGTATLLAAARAAWELPGGGFMPGKKYLQVSTDEVYGSLGPDGFFEETTPLDPHSPYSASKASADLLVKSYWDTYKMPVNITRCSNNYGPLQFPEKLIPLMINNCLSHRNLPVYGDGLQIRDWLYVDDHCKAIDLVARSGRPGEVYNIGGHNERTNLVIVGSIIDNVRRKADPSVGEQLIKHVEDRKGHDRRYGINPQKIKDELGWYPETPFEQGIELTIDWYLSNPGWIASVVDGSYRDYYRSHYGE